MDLPPHAAAEPRIALREYPAPPDPATSARLFPGFADRVVTTSGAEIRVLAAGSGPPLLLLHGHPQTHVMWHKIAPELAQTFTIVVPDLRGYGDSSKPDDAPDHANAAFRAMARDQIDIMRALGYERFMVAGHDRGGRVAHRLCLDHPQAVERVAFLDIVPTLTMYDETSQEFATRYVWWFFQIQPSPVPEHLIGLDPEFYLRHHLAVQSKTPGAIAADALAEYLRCYCCTRTIHAACEDYRAAAGIDLAHDRADDAAGRRITVPVLALWGALGTVGKLWDVLATWRAKADGTVVGRALPCGHYLPEERPDAVLAELRAFFAAPAET